LLGREGARQRDLAAVSLPVGEAAHEGVRGVVAQLRQRLRREGRAVARGAVEDDRGRLVGDDALDPRLEIAPGHVNGARNMALLPLVRLADVDPGSARQVLRPAGVDLRDLGFRACQQLTVRAHNFPNGSGTFPYSRYFLGDV